MKLGLTALIFLISAVFASDNTFARVHYVDPQASATSVSDGSEAAPWQDLQGLIDGNGVKAGDKIYLISGFYGNLFIRNKKLTASAVISVVDGHTAKFSTIKVRNSENWHLKGFTVSVSFPKPDKVRYMVEIGQKSRKIKIENFEIFTVSDTTHWGKSDWDRMAVSGISTRGTDVTILDNKLRNVNFGIMTSGDRTIVSGNLINHFSGDGMRGLGDYSLFEGNIVKNCHPANSNHDDGFQSYSVTSDWKVGTTEVVGTILRRNIFIANDNKQGPRDCQMQGIGMFDGMFVDWVIENNIVIVDHWHGITVMGARNVRILNNTVWDPNNSKPGPAWIHIADHKNGTASTGNLVANNLASQYAVSKTGVLQLQNQIIRNPYALFVDPDNFDFRLKKGSRAIDAGMDGLGVDEDFYGNPRPRGGRTDVGAVEYQN